MKKNLFWQNNELEIKMNVSRCELLIATNLPKKNGERLRDILDDMRVLD